MSERSYHGATSRSLTCVVAAVLDSTDAELKVETLCCKTYFCFVSTMLTTKEGNISFNDALNTFHLTLYGVRHMVNDHSDSERGNPLPPYGLLFGISSKGYFI